MVMVMVMDLRVLFSSLPMKKIAKRDLSIFEYFLSLWGSEERPRGDRLAMRHLRRVMG